jgi:DNA-binding LytR/AlgR family response regulator
MIEIAIDDDDPAITEGLEELLKRYSYLIPEPLHIQCFHEGAAILEVLKNNAVFDMIFLDIELGDTTGIAVAEQIRKQSDRIALIFVSAHESYCKQLFRFDTTAFLEKPIDENELKDVLLQVYKRLRNPHQVFSFHVKDDIIRVPLADILFFESRMRKIELVTRQETHVFYGKLNDIETQLQYPGFVRIHYSYLVNLDNVERFEKNMLFLPGGYQLPLARGRQKDIRRKIMDYYNDDDISAVMEDDETSDEC